MMPTADTYTRAQNLAAEKKILAARIYGDMSSLFELAGMAEVDAAVHAARLAIAAHQGSRTAEQGFIA